MFYSLLEYRNNLLREIQAKYANNNNITIDDIEQELKQRLDKINAEIEDKNNIYYDVLMELNTYDWFRELSQKSSIRDKKIDIQKV